MRLGSCAVILSAPVTRVAFGLLASAGAACSTCSAQWTVQYLHPAGATESMVTGVDGGTPVGAVTTNNVTRAAAWNGSQWVDLSPPGSTSSFLAGCDAAQQVGIASVGGITRAGVWSGTGASWIDLHVPSAISSVAREVHDGQQVGEIIEQVGTEMLSRASLWGGSPASWVNLNPPGSIDSQADGVFEGRQVGWARPVTIGVRRASLWTGTAGSWIDLHPIGTTGSFSRAINLDSTTQVGWIGFGGGDTRASLWAGTAASWVELHPASAEWSEAHDVYAGMQVGRANIAGVTRASLWRGSAASWENLSLALSGSWGRSIAEGIWRDNRTLYVAGSAFNQSTQRVEALLWTRPLTPCEQADTTHTALSSMAGYGVPNGVRNNDDFFYFLAQFAAGNLAVADLTTFAVPGQPGYGVPNGTITNDDFFYYLTLFAAGC